MEISMDSNTKSLIVTLAGEIDHHCSEDIRDSIDVSFAKHGAKNLILVMNRVSFMDSSGIGMIIGRYKTVSTSGGRLMLAGLNENLKRIYEISGLKKIITAYDNTAEALSSAGVGGAL